MYCGSLAAKTKDPATDIQVISIAYPLFSAQIWNISRDYT